MSARTSKPADVPPKGVSDSLVHTAGSVSSRQPKHRGLPEWLVPWTVSFAKELAAIKGGAERGKGMDIRVCPLVLVFTFSFSVKTCLLHGLPPSCVVLHLSDGYIMALYNEKGKGPSLHAFALFCVQRHDVATI